MHLAVLIVFLTISLTVDGLTDYGDTTVTVLNVKYTAGVSGTSSNKVDVKSSGIYMTPGDNPRLWLLKGSSFFKLSDLLGRSIKFTVDFGTSTCGCYAGIQLIHFPSYANPGYKCDSTCSDGNCCSQINLLTADKQAVDFMVAKPKEEYPCEIGGNPPGYGRGGKVINTDNPFSVQVSFVPNSSKTKLSKLTVVYRQSGKTLTGELSNADCVYINDVYISDLTSLIDSDMVLVLKAWIGKADFDFLTCGTKKCSDIVISSIQVLGSYISSAEQESSTSTENASPSTVTVAVAAVIGVIVVIILVVVVVVVVVKRRSQSTEVV